MPSKTVYLNVSGRKNYGSQYSVDHRGWISIHQTSSLPFDEYDEPFIFDMGDTIGEHLPENTKLTSIIINYYYRYNYTNPFTPKYSFGDSRGAYTGSITKSLSSSPSVNRSSVTFLASEIKDVEQINKIKVEYDAHFDFRKELYLNSPYYSHSLYFPNGTVEKDIYNIPVSSYFIIKNQNAGSTYKPYVVLNYEYNPPVAPTSLVPDNSTENPRTPIRFTWNSRINQIAFQLQYQVDGGSWTTVSRTTDNRFYELPAGTITATEGVVNWRVRVAEVDGVYSDYVNGSFNLGVVGNKPPYLSYPVSDYIKDARTVNFSWTFIPNTIEEQTEFELQYRVEGDVWKTVKEVTDRENVDLPLNIDESKVVEWRLRVKNQFDEWTSWTETVQFQVIGSPPAPQIINVANANNPTISWQSRDQEMFEIEIIDSDNNLVFDSGKIIGVGIRNYKVTKDLENGKYLIKLTVFNIYDVGSPTTEYTHIINPEPITAPEISLFESRFSVLIRSNVTDGTVIRDGKVLGQLKYGEFEDFSGVNKKVYNYSIRTKENDIFADSEVKSAKVDFAHHNTLALLDNLKDFMLLSYDLEGDPQRSVALKMESEFIKLDGKKYSVVEVGEHEEETKSFSCFLEKKSDLDKLIELVQSKEIVLLRDTRENNFEGFIQSLNYTYHTFGYQISFTLNRTGDFYD